MKIAVNNKKNTSGARTKNHRIKVKNNVAQCDKHNIIKISIAALQRVWRSERKHLLLVCFAAKLSHTKRHDASVFPIKIIATGIIVLNHWKSCIWMALKEEGEEEKEEHHIQYGLFIICLFCQMSVFNYWYLSRKPLNNLLQTRIHSNVLSKIKRTPIFPKTQMPWLPCRELWFSYPRINANLMY